MTGDKKRRCVVCGLLTYKWQRVDGGAWHCYDGCKSTTGIDRRQPVQTPPRKLFGTLPAQ